MDIWVNWGVNPRHQPHEAAPWSGVEWVYEDLDFGASTARELVGTK